MKKKTYLPPRAQRAELAPESSVLASSPTGLYVRPQEGGNLDYTGEEGDAGDEGLAKRRASTWGSLWD